MDSSPTPTWPLSGTERLAALISAIVLLSALGLLGAAFALPSKPSWFLAGFEALVAIAGVVGVLTGRGWYRDHPPLALACVAGTVFAGSFLGALGAKWDLAGHSLKPVLLGRTLLALLIGAAAAWVVLSGAWRVTLPRLIKGLVLGGVLLAATAALWAVRARLGGLSIGVRFFGGTIVVIVLISLLSASVHLVISAFEAGLTGRRPEASTETPANT